MVLLGAPCTEVSSFVKLSYAKGFNAAERGTELSDVDAPFFMRYAGGWRSFPTVPKALRCFLR